MREELLSHFAVLLSALYLGATLSAPLFFLVRRRFRASVAASMAQAIRNDAAFRETSKTFGDSILTIADRASQDNSLDLTELDHFSKAAISEFLVNEQQIELALDVASSKHPPFLSSMLLLSASEREAVYLEETIEKIFVASVNSSGKKYKSSLLRFRNSHYVVTAYRDRVRSLISPNRARLMEICTEEVKQRLDLPGSLK